jgi:hypothetical protein
VTRTGDRIFQTLAGFRRAREMLDSRKGLFTAELNELSHEMLCQAASDLNEITRLSATMHRACVVEMASNEPNAMAEAVVDHRAEKVLGEKVCLKVFQL